MKGKRKRNGVAAAAAAAAVEKEDAGVTRGKMKKKRKRVFLSETDATRILMRYSAATVMALLREVAKCNSQNVDWNSLAQKSTTGISNAREYQALWRHLAYRTEMADSYGDDAEPSDNDSDLECENLPTPPANSDENKEAVRWVEADMRHIGLGRKRKGHKQGKLKSKSKVPKLSNTSSQAPTSGSPRNGTLKKVVKLPRMSAGDATVGSSPSEKVSKPASDADPESSRSRAAPGQTERKKRKFWSAEEDQELMSAVEVHGEGNWTTLLKGSFTHERTAAQLSQRWALIKKRREAQVPTKVSPNCEADGEEENAVQPTGDPSPPEDSAGNPVDDSTAAVANGIPREKGTAGVQSTSASPEENHPEKNHKDITSDALPVSDSKESVAKTAVQIPEKSSKKEDLKDQQPSLANEVPCKASDSFESAQSIPSGQGQNGVKIEKACPTEVDVPSTPNASAVGTTAAQVPPAPAAGAPTSASTKNANRNNAGSSVAKGTSLKSPTGPGPAVRAAAVAAGARIAPASAAASLLKAAQSGNVVHIGADGVSVTTSTFSSQPGATNNTPGTNVHYIRTGAGIPAPSTQLGAVNGHPSTKNQPLVSATALPVNNSTVSALVPSTVKTEASEAN